MKRISIIFFVISYLLLFQSNISAKNSQSKIDSLIKKTESLDSHIQQNTNGINGLNNKITDAELHKKLVIIEKEIYDRDHKLTMGYVNTLLVIASIVFGLAISTFAISWYFSGKKWKDEHDKKIVEFSKEAKDKLDDKLKQLKLEINNKINESKASFYYDFGIKFFNEKKYLIAIDFLEPLYKSEYRHCDVCFYLSRCFFYISEYAKFIEYLKNSLESTDDNQKAYGIFNFIFEAIKINDLKKDITAFLSNEHSNPREYYQNNTIDLIKNLIALNCKEGQE